MTMVRSTRELTRQIEALEERLAATTDERDMARTQVRDLEGALVHVEGERDGVIAEHAETLGTVARLTRDLDAVRAEADELRRALHGDLPHEDLPPFAPGPHGRPLPLPRPVHAWARSIADETPLEPRVVRAEHVEIIPMIVDASLP